MFSSILMLGLGVTFSIWTASSWLEYPRFLAAAVLLFVLPGYAVARWLRLDMSPIERFNLSFMLGIIATCSLYAAAAWIDNPRLVWLWILIGIVELIRARKSILLELGHSAASAETSHSLLPFAIFAALLPLYVLPFYYGNFALNTQGGMTVGGPKDLLLHLSIGAELTHAFPPQVPFLSGEPLNYHIGMDLVTAVLNRYGGVSIPDLVSRFCPTLFIVAAILSAYCLAYRLMDSKPAAVATALLIVLGEDFAFIPGILGNPDLVWAMQIFQAPTVVSLYLFNPMVAALGLLLSALFCLHRSIDDPRPGWIVAAALCSAALLPTKIFAFVHLAMAMCIAGAVQLVAFKRTIFMKQGIGILLAGLPLLFLTMGRTQNVKPVDWIWSSGLDTYVVQAFQTVQWPLLVAYPFAGLVVYLVGAYGFRILGIVEWFKSFQIGRLQSFNFLMAIFVALGPLIFLTSRISPRDDDTDYNNAIWFMVQSKYVATFFAVIALIGLWKRIGSIGRPILIAAIAAISLASTAQYLIMMRRDSGSLSTALVETSAALMETVRFLNDETRAGQVAFSRIGASMLALTKLRLPYFNLYPYSFAGRESVVARSGDMQAFWQSWDRGTVRADLLFKYRADWIVSSGVNESNAHLGASLQNVGEKLGIKLVFNNEQFRVYRVHVLQQ